MLIGNQQTQVEKTQNHFTYQGTGTRTTFACTYSDNAVLVFLNGIKLKENIDYTIEDTGTFVTFSVPPESEDTVDLYGSNDVTALSRSTLSKETFTADGTQEVFNLTSKLSGGERINVYLNGMRLHETDYTIDFTAKTIEVQDVTQGDVISIDIIQHGFRSSAHNTKAEPARHQCIITPSVVSADMVVKAGENALLVGPTEIQGNIEVEGTLTIV